MTNKPSFWRKYRYQLSAFVLVLPFWFLYQSMTPVFPPAWPAQQVGDFEITPMPLDLEQPYVHHEAYVKDFMLMFNKGKISDIRQGYVNIGPEPIPLGILQQAEDGIMHGNRHGQHVHAITPATFSPTDKMWVTIETWQGQQLTASWDLPETLLK